MVLSRWCQRRLSGLTAGIRPTRGTRRWARPTVAHLAGTGADRVRTRERLLAENALLRHQLVVLRRSVTHPVMDASGMGRW